MSRILKIDEYQRQKKHPRSEVTNPNLRSIQASIRTGLVQLGFDKIIGTQAEVDDVEGIATHTWATFPGALADNDRVLVLAGLHTLTGSIDLTKSGVVMTKEDRTAIIALGAFTLTFSGDENELNLRISGAGVDAFVTSGDYNEMTLWFESGNADPLLDTGSDNIINFHVI